MAVGYSYTETIDPAAPVTPGSVERKRKMAEMLMKQGTSAEPVQHWTQGLARLLQGYVAGDEARSADQSEAEGRKAGSAASEQFARMLMGGDSAPAQEASMGESGGVPVADPNTMAGGGTGEYKKIVEKIESGGNPNAVNKASGAAGLHQFIPSTWKQYAPYDGASPLDPQASNKAFERFTADNWKVMARNLGREPTSGELYLAHQQGAGGASKLLANPNARAADIVGERAVVLNGGRPDMTAGEFANLWTGKYQKFAGMPSMVGAQMPQTGGAAPAQMASVADSITGQQVPVNPDGTAADIFNPETGQPGAMAFAGSQGGQGPGQAAINQATQPAPMPTVSGGHVPPAAMPSPVASAQTAPMPLLGSQGGIPAPRPTANVVRALAAIIDNPWISAEQKSMAMMLAKDQMDRSKPKPFLKMGEGDRLFDPNTNKMIAGPASEANTTSQKDYEYDQRRGFKGTFNDWLLNVKRAGATNVSIDQKAQGAEETERGKGLGTRMNAIADDGAKAAEDQVVFQQLGNLLSGIETGGWANFAENVRRTTGGAVVLDPKNADQAQALVALTNYVAPRLRVPGSGAQSDRELSNFIASIPNIAATPGGNQKILQSLSGIVDWRKKRADIASQWQLGDLSAKEAQKQLDAIPSPFAPIPSAQGQPGSVASPKTKQEYDALPSGARFVDPNGEERIKP